MAADTTVLADSQLVGDLPASERQELADAGTWHNHEQGDKIIERESHDTDMVMVTAGKVSIVNYALSGREIAFDRLGPGDFFGELSAIDGEARSAVAVADTACTVLKVPHHVLRDLIGRYPEVAWRLLNRLANIIRATDERVMDLATLSAQQRVITEVLRNAEPDGAVSGQWAVYPLPTQAAMASRAGTTRETVARVLGQLRDDGLVTKKGKRLTIRDKERLERMVQRLGESVPL